MSDKFKVANAPEKDISQMDFRELRKKVQELNDAFNLAMRKLYDTTENLDESNFSSGFLLKQKNMKAQLTATAKAVELRMTAEDLEDKLVNYSTHNQTATAIRTEVGIIKDDLTTNYSTTSQTAMQIQDTVTDTLNGYSIISQTADTIKDVVSNAGYVTSGAVTNSITTSIKGIELFASSDGKESHVTLYHNGYYVASAYTEFTGLVAFNDLETEGRTTIHGGNIATGTITADVIGANEVKDGYAYVRFKHPIYLSASYPAIAGIQTLWFNNDQSCIRKNGYGEPLEIYSFGGVKFTHGTPTVEAYVDGVYQEAEVITTATIKNYIS